MRLCGSRLATAVTGVLLATAAMSVAPAWGATADKTPPTLKVPPYAQFLQGGLLGQTEYLDGGGSWNSSIPITVGWSAKDKSGICGYTLKRTYEGYTPQVILSRTNVTSYNDTTTDYTNQEGGGGAWPVGWRVIAHDCAGNQTSKDVRTTPSLTQDDGSWDGQDNGYLKITYAGNWAQSHCTCYDAGTVEKTSAKGATATFAFDANAQDSIGLVMEKAANRGEFTVFVDGINMGTVDTHSHTTRHKVIVWAGRVSTTGSHVVKLVNQATSGRPRIDLDAVLLMY